MCGYIPLSKDEDFIQFQKLEHKIQILKVKSNLVIHMTNGKINWSQRQRVTFYN